MDETTPMENSGSQPEAQAVEQAPVSFLDSLPEDLRGEPSLKNFTDAGSLAKSFVHAQRMIGAEKLPLPGKSATEDEWNTIYSKLGRPDSAADYQFDGVQNLEAAEISSFAEAAHKAGLRPQQAQAMLGFMDNRDQGMFAQFEQGTQEAINEGYAELQREWGPALDEKISRATTALISLGLPYERDENGNAYVPLMDEIRLSDGRALGDHPTMIKLFADIADKLGEDTLAGAATTFEMTPKEAQAEKSSLTAPGTPYWDNQHPEHKAAVQRVLELNGIIFPEGQA